MTSVKVVEYADDVVLSIRGNFCQTISDRMELALGKLMKVVIRENTQGTPLS